MKTRSILFTVIIGALMLSSCNYFKKHRLFSKDVDTVLDMAILEPDTIDTLAIAEYEQPVIEEPVYAEPDRYFMIVGSFQNRNLAQIYSDKIAGMGYRSEIIEAANGYYRVTAKSYSDYYEGINEIEMFRESITTNAWLHVRR